MFQFEPQGKITEADLRQLSVDGVEESEILDFKKDVSGKSTDAWSDAQEFAKDVAAFANHRGGQLVLGMDENKKRAGAIKPLTGSSELYERKLRKWTRDHLSPPVPIEVTNVVVGGGFAVVVSVPWSIDQPHAVLSPGNNRKPMVYPCRDGADTRYLTEHEVAGRYVERHRGWRDRAEELDAMAKSGFERLRRGAGLWLWVAAQPMTRPPGKLDGGRVQEIRDWMSRAPKTGPLGTKLHDELVMPGPGCVTFTDAPHVDDCEEGDPRSTYVELFVNGSSFAAVELTRRTTFEPAPGEIGVNTLTSAAVPLAATTAAWAREVVGSIGTADLCFGLVDTTTPPRDAVLVMEQLGELQKVPKTRMLPPDEDGLLCKDRTVVDLAVVGTPAGCLPVTYDVLTLLVQRFGLAEATHLTSDGTIVSSRWGSPSNQQQVKQWAGWHELEVL